MSAIRKLLSVNLSALLLAGTCGCAPEAGTVSTDNSRNDSIYISEITPMSSPWRDPFDMRDQDPVRSWTDRFERDRLEQEQRGEEEPPAQTPPAYDTVELITPDLRRAVRARKQKNAHTVGWLQVPGTNIDDVVLQNPSQNNPYAKENEYYLNRNFYRQTDREGVFCADYRANFGTRADLSRVTAIYAHSWNDDPDSGAGLFSQLKYYRDPGFARQHPYVYFSTEKEDMVWEVFAVFDTTIYMPYVRPALPLDKFHQTLDTIYDLSYYNYDIAVADSDRLLALSTCTYSVAGHSSLPAPNDYRFVVMARLVPPDSPLKDQAVLSVNASPLAPDTTRRLMHL